MKKLLFGLAFFLNTALLANAQQDHYTISFNGEGRMSVVPDQVELNLTISAEKFVAPKVQETLDFQAEKIKKVLDLLAQEGVPENQIATQNYKFQPVYREGGYGGLRSYLVSQVLVVYAPKEKTNTLIEKIAPLAYINSVNFKASNLEQLREEATDLAIRNAKDSAVKRAEQLGIRLSANPVGYSESSYARQEYGARSVAASPELLAGELQVVVS